MRALIIVSVTFLVANARAQDYFPLADGWTWMYGTTDGSSTSLVVIDGMAPVIGGIAVVRHEVISGDGAQEVFNFWTRDPDGRILLHGAYNPDGFLAYYDPPITILDTPPLNVGDAWCTTFSWYDSLSDPEPSGPFTVCYDVTEAQIIVVPAGEFPAIGTEAALLLRTGFDVFGRKVANGLRTPDHWYSADVGEVRFTLGGSGVFDLLDYSSPVGTIATTWGEVKALFE